MNNPPLANLWKNIFQDQNLYYTEKLFYFVVVILSILQNKDLALTAKEWGKIFNCSISTIVRLRKILRDKSLLLIYTQNQIYCLKVPREELITKYGLFDNEKLQQFYDILSFILSHRKLTVIYKVLWLDIYFNHPYCATTKDLEKKYDIPPSKLSSSFKDMEKWGFITRNRSNNLLWNITAISPN